MRRPALVRSMLLLAPLMMAGSEALAQAMPTLTSTPAPGGGTNWSLSIQTLLLLTSLSFLPAVLLMMTSFTRIIIVLSLMRQALGTPEQPAQPGADRAGDVPHLFHHGAGGRTDLHPGLPSAQRNRMSFEQALDVGSKPLKAFMLKQVREPDVELFMRLSNTPKVNSQDELPMRVVVPAYVTSELKTAFQIGFIVFIPFIIIDMVVASVLMSMGMMMMSPVIVSLPFKLMLFVLVDGWNLLLGTLVASFGQN